MSAASKFTLLSPGESLEDARNSDGGIGLNLTRSQSFKDLINQLDAESKNANVAALLNDYGNAEKPKAASIEVTSLRIGNYRRETQQARDLVAKIYYNKEEMMWEIMEDGLKMKIGFKWSTISRINVDFRGEDNDVLDIELKHKPQFYKEKDPVAKKHTLWESTNDFTGDQASKYRCHHIEFPKGKFMEEYDKLLDFSEYWLNISKQGYFYGMNTVFSEDNHDNYQRIQEGQQTMMLPNFPPNFSFGSNQTINNMIFDQQPNSYGLFQNDVPTIAQPLPGYTIVKNEVIEANECNNFLPNGSYTQPKNMDNAWNNHGWATYSLVGNQQKCFCSSSNYDERNVYQSNLCHCLTQGDGIHDPLPSIMPNAAFNQHGESSLDRNDILMLSKDDLYQSSLHLPGQEVIDDPFTLGPNAVFHQYGEYSLDRNDNLMQSKDDIYNVGGVADLTNNVTLSPHIVVPHGDAASHTLQPQAHCYGHIINVNEDPPLRDVDRTHAHGLE